MKLKTKITIIILSALILISAILICFWCLYEPYDAEWIIGKSAEEIIERYGEFDRRRLNEDGFYTMGGYLVKEKRVGYLGTDPEEFYMIYFDSNGYAFDVNDKYIVPGG